MAMKKGDKSKTHKGDKDFTTKKGDKDFHEGGHDEKKKKKPYGGKGSTEMKERMAKLRAMRGKKK